MVDFGRPTLEIVRSLYERQIYIQPGALWLAPTLVRISVGTARDNQIFLGALADVLGQDR